VRRLLLRPGAIGDCILALPELASHRTDYTEVWAPRPILPIVQFADHTRAIPDTGVELLGVIDGHRVPELESFDSIYSWYGANRDEFRDAVRHLPFTFFPALPINRIAEPRIRVPQQPVENFAIIHPFSGSTQKNWPLDNFHDLASRLEIPTRFCAGPDDPLPNAIRIENLFDLACWLSTARVYIGNDSGISHLAAAVGVPTVANFLSTDPRIWAPRGDHVIALENPSVDAVIDAVRIIMRTC
jgi:heptosyltransferase III